MEKRKAKKTTSKISEVIPCPENRGQSHGYGIGESWFEVEETRIEKVLCSGVFWWRVFQYTMLPFTVLYKMSTLNENLASLRSDSSSEKLAGIWFRKLLGYSAAWFALVATIVVWEATGHDVSNAGDHLLRNISTVILVPIMHSELRDAVNN